MKICFFASLLALLAVGGTADGTAGCGKPAGLQTGTYSLTVNNKKRQYMLRVPLNYDPTKPYRVIFGIHWMNSNMKDSATAEGGYYGLQPLANETAIFVSPDGLNQAWGNQGGEDIKLIDAIVQQLDEALCVDPTQRFAMGWSYGAAMCYAIACALPDKFRAVALYSGAQLSGCDGGTKPIALWFSHGTHDSVLSYSMGTAMRDHFLTVNQCVAKDAPQPARNSGTHIKTEYDCLPDYPIWWYAHDGDHTYTPADRGQPTWAPDETWKFFSMFNSTTPAPTPEPTTPAPTTVAPTTPVPTTAAPTTPVPTTPAPTTAAPTTVAPTAAPTTAAPTPPPTTSTSAPTPAPTPATTKPTPATTKPWTPWQRPTWAPYPTKQHGL